MVMSAMAALKLSTLTLSALEKWAKEKREQEGDLPCFIGDMRGMTTADLGIFEDEEDEGKKFAHIGDW